APLRPMRNTRWPHASRKAVSPVPMSPRAPATARCLAAPVVVFTVPSSGIATGDGLHLQQPPQVPRREAAVGRPVAADLLDAPRRRGRAQAIGALHALAHAEVAGGEHVGAPEPEHEKHLHRPGADAADLYE